MDDLLTVLSRNVRRLRQKSGLSQDELGERAKLHRTYVGAIERGERNITLQSLARLAKALGVRPEALLSKDQ